jgi:ribosome maturation factor RimP
MHRLGNRLFLGLLVLCVLAGYAQGAMVFVSVYEVSDNSTVIPHAIVYVNGAMTGKTGADGRMNFTHPGTGSIDLRVTKAGYEDWNGLVGANTSSVLIPLIRKNLTFVTEVYDADSLNPIPGARVILSGMNTTVENTTDKTGSATFLVKGDAGYTIEVSAPHYQSRSASVEAGSADKEVQYWLFRADRLTIRIIDEQTREPVPDAEIAIDTTPSGMTDARGTLTIDLPRNKLYTLRVAAAGYQNAVEKRLIGEEESLIDVSLTRSPYQVFVSVYDESRSPVEGAVITIDGKEVGKTNTYGRYSIQDLNAGTYLLEVSSPGYVSRNMQFQAEQQGQDVTVSLVSGEIDLVIFVGDEDQKVVPGATIIINNSSAGVTDSHGQLKTRIRLNTPYLITASKDGYQSGSVPERITNATGSATTTIVLEKNFDPVPFVVGGIILICIIGIILVIRQRSGRRTGHTIRKDRI